MSAPRTLSCFSVSILSPLLMQAYLIFRRVPTSHLLVRSQQGRSFALAASICQRADREECLY
ncbi:hypothetical protein, partial [Escherichia coli]|uniref:hypothetical protein n=1 Tax=Escherichia coli TaxID=562 RepID=UPI0019537E2D